MFTVCGIYISYYFDLSQLEAQRMNIFARKSFISQCIPRSALSFYPVSFSQLIILKSSSGNFTHIFLSFFSTYMPIIKINRRIMIYLNFNKRKKNMNFSNLLRSWISPKITNPHQFANAHLTEQETVTFFFFSSVCITMVKQLILKQVAKIYLILLHQ